jgi:hypothetical protein
MPATVKPLPAQSAFIPGQEGHAEKKRWFKCEADETAQAIIDRAIRLKLATLACCEPDNDLLFGQMLAAICREWMEFKVAEISGDGS